MPWQLGPKKDVATLRKATGSCLQADPWISEWGNPSHVMMGDLDKRGQAGELKHLSTPRKGNNSRSSGERTGKSPNPIRVIGCRRCVDGG